MPWADIQGHERWIQAFRHIRSGGRLAHAYLFVGPPGIGKRSFALQLAKGLLCEQPLDPITPCDTCSSCHLVTAQTHPDLFLVDKPAGSNEMPLEVVRELCTNFGLKSARGGGKIAILDDADDLNEESANCFLKTLEEPPPQSVFILVGNSLERQLPTIRSRCQVIRFAPLPEPVMREVLAKSPGIEPDMVPRLMRLSAGSPGLALELADPVLWKFRNQLLAALAQPNFDPVEMSRNLVQFVEDAGKETALHRQRASRVLRLLLQALQDALRVWLGETLPPAESGDLQLLQTLAQRATPEKILALMERCLETETQINRYIPLGLVLEGLLEDQAQILEKNP